MNTYSIASDSPRWWWPSAAGGTAAVAAIAAILLLPSAGTTLPGDPVPRDPGVRVSDPWVTTIDPGVGRQCYALRARWDAGLTDPRCGQPERSVRPRRR